MTIREDRAGDLEREVGELRRQLGESRAQQEAAAEVLQVINSSSGDLAPVFDAILERAICLCKASLGYFLEYDGERFRASVFRGASPEFIDFMAAPLTAGETGGALSALVRGDFSVHVADMKASEAYRSGNPARRALVDLGGGRTGLWIALRNGTTLLGTFVLYRLEVRPFSDNEIALITSFAAQAVIAMENARLLTETREALDQQTATAEVLQVINASPGDLAPVFDAMLDKAMRLCSVAFGSLQTYDGEVFRSVAERGLPVAFAERLRQGYRSGPGHPASRLIEGERFAQVPNLAETDTPQGAFEIGGMRTLLSVPMRREGKLVGIINLARDRVELFTDKQIALVENFAAQAVIAMENARLLTETREALDQQTATAEVLQVINSSPGDLAPVFDAILEKAHSLCGSSHGSLFLSDGEHFRPVAMRGVPERFAERLRAGFRGSEALASQPLLAGDRFVHIADMAQVDNPMARAAVELAGARTLLSVPLRKGDALLGIIVATRFDVLPFTEKQIALLQNFADQAVIAMENARLLTETKEALDQRTATAEVLQVINSSPGNLAPVFEAILEKARSLCGVAYGSLELYDGVNFRAVATVGFSETFAGLVRQGYPAAESPDTRALIEGKRFSHILDLAETDAVMTRSAVELDGHRTLLCVPLRRDDQLLGMIASARTEVRPFSDKEIALLENFAAQAVIAMENARLITETREALDQQTATAEVLQVINSSPGDLAPVFDAMLEKAMRLCGAAFGNLLRYDGDRFHVVAALHGEGDIAERQRHRAPFRAIPGSLLYPIVRGEHLAFVEDVLEGEAYRSGTRGPFHEMVDSGGYRSILNVALRKEGALSGVIGIFRKEVGLFSDKQIALLQNFAAQAVIAMENARLLGELRARTEEVAGLNRDLEARVASQLAELERTGKLRRFLAPQLADLIVAQGDESILESHRREIVVVFCDLRGFTAFAERAEPEEVMALLRDYHAALGPIVARFEGTLDHYAGDGIMVFFNDPLPTPNPAKRAIEMAVAMREAAQALLQSWRRHGHDIGFGVGISQGYATLGQIGFAERMDYTAIGTVTNLAARLCGEAKDGQILISRRVATAVEDMASLEEIGDLSLKGLSQAVAVYNVIG